MSNLLEAAKLLIAKYWKSRLVPNIQEWRVKCQYLCLMNKLTAVKLVKNGNKDAYQIFLNVWLKFIILE